MLLVWSERDCLGFLGLNEGDLGYMKYEYGELRELLLEVDREAVIVLTRELPGQPSFSIY